MSKRQGWGFTLIELLTVIAIIGILVGISAAVLPKAIESAKVTRTEADMTAVKGMLVKYQADHGSLPPGYGYRIFPKQTGDPPTYVTEPYTLAIGAFGDPALLDATWSENGDTNRNQDLDMMEYIPAGVEGPPGKFSFATDVFRGNPAVSAAVQNDIAAQMSKQKPYLYFPVNKEQADIYRDRICLADDGSGTGKPWRPYGLQQADVANPDSAPGDIGPAIRELLAQFPPPYYDDYVLLSVGPLNDTGGIVPKDGFQNGAANAVDGNPTLPTMLFDPELGTGGNEDDTYYLNALQVFFLATRDVGDTDTNNAIVKDDKPDFSFRTRTSGSGHAPMPNRASTYGPIILHGKG